MLFLRLSSERSVSQTQSTAAHSEWMDVLFEESRPECKDVSPKSVLSARLLLGQHFYWAHWLLDSVSVCVWISVCSVHNPQKSTVCHLAFSSFVCSLYFLSLWVLVVSLWSVRKKSCFYKWPHCIFVSVVLFVAQVFYLLTQSTRLLPLSFGTG